MKTIDVDKLVGLLRKRARVEHHSTLLFAIADDLESATVAVKDRTPDRSARSFPPDCADGQCYACRRCYSDYVAAKMTGELDAPQPPQPDERPIADRLADALENALRMTWKEMLVSPQTAKCWNVLLGEYAASNAPPVPADAASLQQPVHEGRRGTLSDDEESLFQLASEPATMDHPTRLLALTRRLVPNLITELSKARTDLATPEKCEIPDGLRSLPPCDNPDCPVGCPDSHACDFAEPGPLTDGERGRVRGVLFRATTGHTGPRPLCRKVVYFEGQGWMLANYGDPIVACPFCGARLDAAPAAKGGTDEEIDEIHRAAMVAVEAHPDNWEADDDGREFVRRCLAGWNTQNWADPAIGLRFAETCRSLAAALRARRPEPEFGDAHRRFADSIDDALRVPAPHPEAPEGETREQGRGCNKHGDCEAAEAKAKEEGKPERCGPGSARLTHCHDDDCEDCFGK